ncbi:hypothetical protein XELAEV_180094637mg, partial [Xenopus laevis]
CREDSFQSIVSCSALLLSHADQTSEENKSTDEDLKIIESAK